MAELKPRTTMKPGALRVGSGMFGDKLPRVNLQGQKASVKPPPLAIVAFTRLGYGLREGDLDNFNKLPGTSPGEKFKAYVEQQLNPASIDDAECDKRLEGFNTFKKSIPQAWKEHYKAAPEGDQKYLTVYRPVAETKAATLLRALYSKRQLQEVLVDFWHNHFNVSPDRDERIAPLFAHYDAQVIRKHSLGNFGAFLKEVAMHPCMLRYLDNESSSRAGPNENWARELFELHTLGAENYLGVKRQREVPGFAQGQPTGYVDDDIYEATRCFTGWRTNNGNDWEPGITDEGTFTFYAPWHDRFQKTVLGRYMPPDQPPLKDGLDVLETLANHPGTARFISRKLVRRLVSDDPPEDLVEQAARVFYQQRKAPDQLKQVVQTIVLSEAFAQTWGEKIKRPFEAFASMLRALDAELIKPLDIDWMLQQLGQPLFGRIPPDGYPDRREAWYGTGGMLERWRWAQGLSGNWWEQVRADVIGQTPTRKPKEVLSFWVKRALGRQLSANSQNAILLFMKDIREDLETPLSNDDVGWFIPLTVAAILSSPEFQWR